MTELRDRVNDFTRTIEEVADLLIEENALIEQRRFEQLAVFQDRKAFLTGLYKRQATGMAAQREAIEKLEPAVRDRLEAASLRLASEVARNMRLIEAAERATKRVMDMVVTAARNTQTEGRYPTQRARNERQVPRRLSVSTNTVI